MRYGDTALSVLVNEPTIPHDREGYVLYRSPLFDDWLPVKGSLLPSNNQILKAVFLAQARRYQHQIVEVQKAMSVKADCLVRDR